MTAAVRLSVIADSTVEPAKFLILSMPGVQSFVAQRQQGYQNPSRQILGAQTRVPVPTTKFENPKEKPSSHRPNTNQPAGLPVAGHSTHWSKQQSAKVSIVQGGFDTDAEGFDETVTMSVGTSSRGHQGEVNDRNHNSSRYVADTANDIISGAPVFFRRGQKKTHHFQSRQLDTDGSRKEGDEGSYPESSDDEEEEEEVEEPDDEELIRDGILQDLNSPDFSQYVQAETSDSTRAAFQSTRATAVAHSGLVLRDVVQHPQRPVNPLKSTSSSIDNGAADIGVNLQSANRQFRERIKKKNSGVLVQKVQSPIMEQVWVSAHHLQFSDHNESCQQPSVTSHQTLRPTGVAHDIIATYVQPHANGVRSLSVQKGSIDLSSDDLSIHFGSDFDRRHDREPTASVAGRQARQCARDLDHSPNQLSSMTFQQLSNESFDLASDPARASIPQELLSGSLATQMEYVLKTFKHDDAKLVQRRAFFSSLSIEQYEECASLIIGRFSAIVSKLMDARQQRRRAAKDFEEVVAKREECIRGKTTVVNHKLGRLKRGGEEVVRGAAL